MGMFCCPSPWGGGTQQKLLCMWTWLRRFSVGTPQLIHDFVTHSQDFIHPHKPGKGCTHGRVLQERVGHEVLLVLQHGSWRNHKFAAGHGTGLAGPLPLTSACRLTDNSFLFGLKSSRVPPQMWLHLFGASKSSVIRNTQQNSLGWKEPRKGKLLLCILLKQGAKDL